MEHVYYIANGLTSRSTTCGTHWGMSEFRIRNLAEEPARVQQRLYFANQEPIDLPPLEIGPMGGPYQEFPRDLPEEVRDAGPWGAKIVSTQPLAYLHIALARRNGRSTEHAFGGGCAAQLAQERLATEWVFPDNFRMIVPAENPPFPFSQFEWVHVLNPHPFPVDIAVTIGDEGYREERRFVVGAERVWFVDDVDFHSRLCCWVRLGASAPVLAQAERVIFGPKGPEEWGVVIGCASPGAAGPFR